MGKITGRLVLTLLPAGEVQMVFTPNGAAGNARPLLAKNTGQAEDDLVRTFGFVPGKARARISELESAGQVDVVVSIDEGLAASLFRQR
jgi:hypothetical protein